MPLSSHTVLLDPRCGPARLVTVSCDAPQCQASATVDDIEGGSPFVWVRAVGRRTTLGGRRSLYFCSRACVVAFFSAPA